MLDARVLAAMLNAGLLIGSGCDGVSDRRDARGGLWYHAHLTVSERELVPFFLRVPDDCKVSAATIVNGEERLEAECRRSPVGFVVDFPVYGTRLEAWFKPDGTLTGHWCRERPDGREPLLPLTLRPVSGLEPSTRFPAAPEENETEPAADVAGVWRMEFGSSGLGRGVFARETEGVLTGTVEMPSEYGDLRFLAGNVRGRRMQLSTFDGQHAFLLQGEIHSDGTLAGEWVHPGGREAFVAERDGSFEIPDPLARVPFVPGEHRLELAALRSPKFDGKAVIVEIFGTWCPNCNDQAPLLVDLYRRHRSHGLEILGLAYEFGFDSEYKERRVAEFKKRHGVEWDVVLAGSTFEDLAHEGLGGLGPIEGVPVAIFLNRDRTVHAVYSGFSGPATGEAHLAAKVRFDELTAQILAAR